MRIFFVLFISCFFLSCAKPHQKQPENSPKKNPNLSAVTLVPYDLFPDSLGPFTLGMLESEMSALSFCHQERLNVSQFATGTPQTDWACGISNPNLNVDDTNYGVHLVFLDGTLAVIHLVAQQLPSFEQNKRLIAVGRFMQFFKQIRELADDNVVFPNGDKKMFQKLLAKDVVQSVTAGKDFKLRFSGSWAGVEITIGSQQIRCEIKKTVVSSTPQVILVEKGSLPLPAENHEEGPQRHSIKISDFSGLDAFAYNTPFSELQKRVRKNFCKLTPNQQFFICRKFKLGQKPFVARFSLNGCKGLLSSLTFTKTVPQKLATKEFGAIYQYFQNAVGPLLMTDPEQEVQGVESIRSLFELDEGDWERYEFRLIPKIETKGMSPVLFIVRYVMDGNVYYKFQLSLHWE